jgi:secondary thiamine-phosphate synthase enzyme
MNNTSPTAAPIWAQYAIKLPPVPRGCHLITSNVPQNTIDLSRVRTGLMHVFIQHTSASLTLNENADPDVRVDMETALNHIAPEGLPYTHTMEGPDDMPAHVKNSLLGSSLSLPVTNGHLALGTWQGIYLCEHRNHGTARKLLVTLFGTE